MKERKTSRAKVKDRRPGVETTSPARKSEVERLRTELTRTREEARQRTAELSLINGVQQALASQLDVKDIYDLVGDKIREIFNAQVVMISLYDPQANTIEHRYAIERGERVYAPGARPLDGFRNRIIQSRAPLLVNRKVVRLMAELGQSVLPGTATPKSWLGVPMFVGKQVAGVVSLQNLDREGAFGQSDVSLLQTLASSMSVALENARLFSETRRRADELATINRISSALASQWEVGALIQLAGEQIRDTFSADIAYVALLDRSSNLIRFPYTFGENLEEIPVGMGLTSKILETCRPLLINRDLETRRAEIGAKQVGVRVKSYLGVPILVGTEAIGAVSVQSIQQEGRFNENDQRLLMTIAATLGAAIENARLFKAEQRRAEQFRVISEVGYDISSIRAVDELLADTAKLIRETFHYYHVGFGLIEGNEVVYHAGAGVLADDPEFQFAPPRLEVGREGITGWVAATGEPLLVPDVRREPRYVEMEGSRTLSELIVPITVKDKVIGVLDAQNTVVNAFDETDLALLQALALQVGVAIENDRLYAQAQHLAVMEERNRLARDLHDAVTQTLFSASLIADALPASWESDPEEGRQLLAELRRLSRGALAEMRTLLLELRPATLTESNLATLIRQLSEAAAGREGLSVTVDAELDCKLSPEVHVALYRIAQEALNNVVKHAQANRVTVSLQCVSTGSFRGPQDRVLLCVADDGRGFDLTRVPPDHFGLGNMRERAQAIGATFEVESRPGSGTRVKVEWDRPV